MASFNSDRSGKRAGWQTREGEEDADERRQKENLKAPWGKTAERTTMMKMTYQEIGAPLTMILWAILQPMICFSDQSAHRAEEASGPTTTVEMVTLEAAENLDLPFDDDET